MISIVRLALIVSACCTASAAVAQPMTCDDLWFLRNLNYKDAGYCFHTPRAIARFGNAGCQFDDEASVPLTPKARRIVADLERQERVMGCR